MRWNIFCWKKGFDPVTGPPSFPGANFQQMVIVGVIFWGLRNFPRNLKLCHLVTWWKRLGISAIKTGQDAPSWKWCTWRLSFFLGGLIVLQCFVHVQSHFQPLPTKLVFAYFDRGSYIYIYTTNISIRNYPQSCNSPKVRGRTQNTSKNINVWSSEFCSKFVLTLKEIIIGFRKAFRVTSATQVSASAKTCF